MKKSTKKPKQPKQQPVRVMTNPELEKVVGGGSEVMNNPLY